jgi:glycosyltransferase involved in cell wall biosynthesis
MLGVHNAAGTWRRRIKTYIAVSEFARQKYIAAGFPAEQITVKPNFLHPNPIPGEGRGGYALYVGRLNPEKGVTTMLEAWKNAQHAIPLKVVGQGPLAEFVQAAAGAFPHIQYLGSKPFIQVLDLMRNAEFLVFPSEVYETMGRTIMESFAVGTPVLASNLGPMATMVVSGKTGFHFSPGNAAELRQKIEWCSANPDQMRTLRANAHAAFEAEYTGGANLKRLLAIYTAALGKQ